MMNTAILRDEVRYIGGLLVVLTLLVPFSANAEACPRVDDASVICRFSEYMYRKQPEASGRPHAVLRDEGTTTHATTTIEAFYPYMPSTSDIDHALEVQSLKAQINLLQARLTVLLLQHPRGV